MDVILYAHTHWDREWYRPFQEFRLRLIEVVNDILAQLESAKLNCFYLDGQTIILDDYLEIYPDKKQLILELIKNKRLQIGPWYILADEFLVSGESLIRNLLIGIKTAKEYGCTEFTGYMPDSFGHNAWIPAILKSFNIDSAVVWRGAGEQKTEFLWASPDGSAVFTIYLAEGYFQDILNQTFSVKEKARKIGKFLNKIKEFSLTDTILLPSGGDHLGIANNLNIQIEEINNHINNYTIKQDSIVNYINNVKAKNAELKEIKGELRDNSRNFILPGVYSSRLYLKKHNIKAQWKLSKLAEPLQAHLEFAGLLPERKKELEYAWKLLMKNHPHDSICGCSVDEVHDEMMTRFQELEQLTDGIIGRCFYALSGMVKKGDIIAYNSTDHAFTGVIKVKTTESLPEKIKSQYLCSDNKFPQEVLFNTQRAPYQEDIREHKDYLIWVEDLPPHSITIIDEDYEYKKHPTIVETTQKYIKNSLITLKVNNNGVLTLSDSDSGKDFYNLHILHDLADRGDSYNFCPLKNDHPIEGILVRTEVLEDGELRGKLRLFYELEIPESLDKDEKSRSIVALTHIVIVDIIVHADSRRVEFKTSWENYSRDHVLQLKFRFSDKIYKAISEDTFGLIERNFDPDYSLSGSMPAEKDKELKTNTAPMQRFVWANGLGIITEGLTEYGVDDNDLYITLLKAVGKLSRGAIDTRGTPAGPPLDIPGAQGLGKNYVRYALCVTDTPEKLFMEADQFMMGILTETGFSQNSKSKKIPKNLLNYDNPHIYTYAVKLPENNIKGVITRLMNLSGEDQEITITSDQDFKFITEVNSLENPLSESVNIKNKIRFKPYELKSFRLE